jgi:hypothetical protein
VTGLFHPNPSAVDEILAEIEVLVRRRDTLRLRRAGAEELEANQLELDRLRWLLALAVREAAVREGPRAA